MKEQDLEKMKVTKTMALNNATLIRHYSPEDRSGSVKVFVPERTLEDIDTARFILMEDGRAFARSSVVFQIVDDFFKGFDKLTEDEKEEKLKNLFA